MRFGREISLILPRKIIAATISGSLFAILLGLLEPDPFREGINAAGEYLREFVLSVPVYLMYSFPVILLYGTLTSTISDFIARLIVNYTNDNFKVYISLTLHIIFGLILLWYSLLASFLYFITDYILSKKDSYKWNNALKSLGLPILVWIVFMGSVYIMEMFR